MHSFSISSLFQPPNQFSSKFFSYNFSTLRGAKHQTVGSRKLSNISQGSVAKRLKCGDGVFGDDFITNLLPSLMPKEFENRSAFNEVTSMTIQQHLFDSPYGQFFGTLHLYRLTRMPVTGNFSSQLNRINNR